MLEHALSQETLLYANGAEGFRPGTLPRFGDYTTLEEARPPITGHVQELTFEREQLGALRRFLARWATEQQLDRERTEELVLAVNELATNSVRHGGGHGELRVWAEEDTLLCEVQDQGHIEESHVMVGREPPAPEDRGGRGLWLVNHLCDQVQIRSSRAGSVVRVLKRRD